MVEPAVDPEWHVDNHRIDRIFFESRNHYFDELGIDDLWRQPVTPQLRELLIRFESEAHAGERLACRSNVVSRSRRAFVMEQELTHDGRVVATCRSVHVAVSAATRTAAEIPEDLWSAIERFEGDLR